MTFIFGILGTTKDSLYHFELTSYRYVVNLPAFTVHWLYKSMIYYGAVIMAIGSQRLLILLASG